MAAPRKIFRIEETMTARFGGAVAPPALDQASDAMQDATRDHAEVMQALGALRAAIAVPSPLPAACGDRSGDAALAELSAERLKRMVEELEAVVTDSAEATQKILAAAEEIDQIANNLVASLKDKIEQGAAADISDLVIRIFEACNFQDLSGQRIAKVKAALNAAEAPAADAAHYLHGPRLGNDGGHMNQGDIDALFSDWTVPTH
jgi:chemotaxis protein CheZ